MIKRGMAELVSDCLTEDERVVIWPAQDSQVFWDDYTRLGRLPAEKCLDDLYGRPVLVYGPVCANKSTIALIVDKIQEYFEPAGIMRWCFVPKVMQGQVKTAESRTDLGFRGTDIVTGLRYPESDDEDDIPLGQIVFVDKAEDILQYAGDRFRSEVIFITECMFMDSGIIRVAHDLSRFTNKLVIMEGLDLNYRGEYFPFRDFNGLTMEDLIQSVDIQNRFPQYSYCTAHKRDPGFPPPLPDARFRLDDRHRYRARFTQRSFPNKAPCPWHDVLVKLRNYRERTGLKHESKKKTPPDKYHSVCAQHLVVPGHEVPDFVRGVVSNIPGISKAKVVNVANEVGLSKKTMGLTVGRMVEENHLLYDKGKLYLPTRRIA